MSTVRLPSKPIAAFAAKFDGEYLSSYRRVDSCDADNRNAVDDNDIADDEQLLTFGVVEMPESSLLQRARLILTR